VSPLCCAPAELPSFPDPTFEALYSCDQVARGMHIPAIAQHSVLSSLQILSLFLSTSKANQPQGFIPQLLATLAGSPGAVAHVAAGSNERAQVQVLAPRAFDALAELSCRWVQGIPCNVTFCPS
jgi:hypothetical protein